MVKGVVRYHSNLGAIYVADKVFKRRVLKHDCFIKVPSDQIPRVLSLDMC